MGAGGQTGVDKVHIMEVITGGETGGAQRHVADLTRFLVQRGHRVTVVHGGGKWLTGQVESVARVVYLPWLTRAIRPVRDVLAYRALTRAIQSARPDVVHLHSSKAGLVGRAAAFRAGVRAVYTAHGYVFQDPTLPGPVRTVYRWIEEWGARRSAAVIVMTPGDLEWAERWVGRARSAFIPNGVGLADPPPKAPRQRPAVGFIGRLTREKGLDVLLPVAAAQSRWDWVIAGDGPLADQVADAARSWPHIVWTGWMDQPRELFAQVDVVVQPSWKEGAPYTVLEAMAAGLPVVGTRVGAMPEMLGRVDSRLLVDPGDRAGLAQAIDWALTNRPWLGAKSREVIARDFSRDRQQELTLGVLQRVIEVTGGRP